MSPGCNCCTPQTCGKICVVPTGCAGGGVAGATVVMKQTVISAINLVSGGSGYTNGLNRNLNFTGGGGGGAAGLFDVVSNAVTNIRLTSGGSGYTSAPTISFPGAGFGSGSCATATLSTNILSTCDGPTAQLTEGTPTL